MQKVLYSPFSLTKNDKIEAHLKRSGIRLKRSRTYRRSKRNTFEAEQNVSPLEAEYAAYGREKGWDEGRMHSQYR